MGQWDPELRASAEARQASKQAESKTKQRLAKANEAARRTPKMVLGEERRTRAEEVGGNQGLRGDKGGTAHLESIKVQLCAQDGTYVVCSARSATALASCWSPRH